MLVLHMTQRMQPSNCSFREGYLCLLCLNFEEQSSSSHVSQFRALLDYLEGVGFPNTKEDDASTWFVENRVRV